MQRSGSCLGCSHGESRRSFVKRCGFAIAALGGLSAGARAAGEPKPRIALVFLYRRGSSWPYPSFDVRRREQEVLETLKGGCPDLEFVPVVVETPKDVEKAVALKGEVDGYLVYVVTLAWDLQRCINDIGRLGRPTLVADEFLGGSGAFLCGLSSLRREGIPAAAVATTRPADLVAVARCFAAVKREGVSAASFARECDQAYRKTFPGTRSTQWNADPVRLADIRECVKRFREARFLIVGGGKAGQEQDFLGAKGIHVGFEEFRALYDSADRDEASQWAQRWIGRAEKVVEADPEWIQRAAAVYLATLKLLKKHGTDTVTMNCLGGFAKGQLPAYPCLGFMQLLDDGAHGVCEAMPDDTISILMARILTGRPGFVSDPVLDTSKGQIVYAHCVATTKVFGPAGDANPFRIRTLHDRDPRGTCAQSFMPSGYMTTSFRTSFGQKKLVIHQAKAVGNLDSDRGCRTQLVGEVRGDIGRLFDEWDRFGWHRVTVYGDVGEAIEEFGKALGLEVVREG